MTGCKNMLICLIKTLIMWTTEKSNEKTFVDMKIRGVAPLCYKRVHTLFWNLNVIFDSLYEIFTFTFEKYHGKWCFCLFQVNQVSPLVCEQGLLSQDQLHMRVPSSSSDSHCYLFEQPFRGEEFPLQLQCSLALWQRFHPLQGQLISKTPCILTEDRQSFTQQHTSW